MRLLFPARGFPTANGRGASFLVTMLEVSSKSSVLLLCLAIITLNINTVVAQTTTASNSPTSEGFFSSQSSYALVSDTLDLSRGTFLGLSFRTCSPGEILKQTWDGNRNDEFKMEVNQLGNLVLTLTTDEIETASVGANLLDAQWHTVLISVDEVTSDLNVSVSNVNDGSPSSVNVPGSVIQSLQLESSSPQFIVGGGMVAGCFREGPGIRFTKSDVLVRSDAVRWLGHDETCILPSTCDGKKIFFRGKIFGGIYSHL